MRLVEWAFEQDIPHAEKLVLLWLAYHAGHEGVGLMDRDKLARDTGYKKRSIQRLLKSLRDAEHLADIGPWYRVGPFFSRLLTEQLAELPEDIRPLPPEGHTGIMTMQEIADAEGGGQSEAEYIGQVVADILGAQIQAGFHELQDGIDRLVMSFHEEREPPEPLPDPVLENPLYQTLVDQGLDAARAYALSAADLELEEVEEQAAPAAVVDAEYSNDMAGRFNRVIDILHGADADKHENGELRALWGRLERDENKHTVKGETDAFILLYPAIVEAAKASVGKLTMREFIDPVRIRDGLAPWDQALLPATDKSDDEMMAEIAQMVAELEATADPRCEVGPRTTEKADDGTTRTETVLGYYRRVKLKHVQMENLKAMGAL